MTTLVLSARSQRDPIREKITAPASMWPSPVAVIVTTIGGGKAPWEPFAHATDVIVTVSRSPVETAVPDVVSGPPPQDVAHVSQAR